MDSRNLAIGVLSVSAVVLLVGIFIVNTRPTPAVAAEVSTYGGDFTVTVGRATRDTELLYVIDNTTERMVVYTFNRRTGAPDIVTKINLAQAQSMQAQPPPQP